MTINGLDLCLRVSRAHASLNLKLDDELGTLHGLSFVDFNLLHLLSRADGGRVPIADLVRPLGVQMSGVIRQLAPLEKTGLIARESGPSGSSTRYATLRPAGRALLSAALVTAGAVCDDAVAELKPTLLESVAQELSVLCTTESLNV